MGQVVAMPKHGPLVAKKLTPTVIRLIPDLDRADRDRFIREFNENQQIYKRALEELKERFIRRGHPVDADYEEFYRIWDAQTEDFKLYIRYACPRDGLKLEQAVNMLAEDECWLWSFAARLDELEELEKRAKRRRKRRQ